MTVERRRRGVAVGLMLGLLGMLAVACQSSVDAKESDRERNVSAQPWTLLVQSSGGIAGRGQGSIEISSNGLVELTTAAGQACRETLDGPLIEDLDAAIDAAEPERWYDRYILEQGADMFHYTLTLERSERGEEIVEWNDGGELPDDLRDLWKAIRAVRDAVDCTRSLE